MSIVDTSRASEPGTFAVAMGNIDRLLAFTPEWLVAVVARFSIAAVFWKSGQTKIEGFAIDLVEGRFTLGVPRFADSTIDLFKDEYNLPFIPPELAAVLATIGEHVFPVLILFGLATRVSALALLAMTAVIQVFVYPGAYPLHGVWAAVLLYLMRHGAGPVSLDALIARRG
jgi:putative oxidoreductase